VLEHFLETAISVHDFRNWQIQKEICSGHLLYCSPPQPFRCLPWWCPSVGRIARNDVCA